MRSYSPLMRCHFQGLDIIELIDRRDTQTNHRWNTIQVAALLPAADLKRSYNWWQGKQDTRHGQRSLTEVASIPVRQAFLNTDDNTKVTAAFREQSGQML